jgi:hypothetical protein
VWVETDKGNGPGEKSPTSRFAACDGRNFMHMQIF